MNYAKGKYTHRLTVGIGLVILACFTGEGVMRAGWFDVLEHTYYDLWHVLAGPGVVPGHAAIVAIDDKTLLEHRDEPLAFWGSHYADAIEVLRTVGTRIIGFDIALNVSAESWLKKLDLPGTDTSRTHDISMRKQLASGHVVLSGTLAGIDQGKGQLVLPLDEHLFVLPRGLADVGLTNFFPDADGVIRHFVPALFDDGTPPSLTFAALLSVRAEGLEANSPRFLFKKWEMPNAPLPQRIGFVGPPGTIPRISFSRLLDPRARADPEIRNLKDKVVIIGADNMANQDMHLTPYAQRVLSMGGRLMSGPETHANIVETILTGNFPRLLPNWLRISYIVAVVVGGTILFFKLSPWGSLGLASCLAWSAPFCLSLFSGCIGSSPSRTSTWHSFWLIWGPLGLGSREKSGSGRV
jgi:CHASE2 domain-containing sensor protein